MARYNTQTRFVFVVTVSIMLAVSLLYALALRRTDQLIHIQDTRSDQEVVRTIEAGIQDRLAAAELALTMIVRDPHIQQLVANRDRQELLSDLEPAFAAVSDRISRFHIHLPDGTSFLRLHQPDQFGDQLTRIRPMIRQIVETGETIRGLEMGVHGLSYRVVMPVYYEGLRVGSAEFGVMIDDTTVIRFQQRRSGDYYLYVFEPDSTRLLAGTSSDDPCPVLPEELVLLRQGETVARTTCSFRDRLLIVPLRDYSGEVVAFLKVISDRGRIESGLRTMRYQLSMLGLFAVITIPVIAWVLLNRLLRPLSGIVAQTRLIADRIAEGDLDYRGDVDYSASEFQEVIQEINRMLEALRAAGYQKQAILDGFPGMLYYVDNDLNILWANRGALAERPDMVGNNVRNDYGTSDFLSCEECILTAAVEYRRIERGSSWFPKNGAEKGACWEYAAVPIVRSNGTVSNLVMIAWDVTEKMHIQEELQKLNTHLEDRVAEEIRKRERQEQVVYHHAKLAAIGELAAGMAHEINQPLNTLSFTFENLAGKMSEYPEAAVALKEKEARIETSIDRIRRLIDHVRTFSREQSHPFSEVFGVATVIDRALSLVESQYRSHGIDLSASSVEMNPQVRGNPYELEQVLLNLLSNARDAVQAVQTRIPDAEGADRPMTIRINVDETDLEVTVSVTDNGTGISPEILDRVMDPFFTTKGPKDGTGLGLSISYGLVHEMGGTIHIVSSEGEGTTVVVTLPKAGPDAV